MSMKSALYQRLKNDPGINAGIYGGIAPGDADFPRVTFDVISKVVEYHQGGASDLREQRYQVTVWSLDSVEAEDIAIAIEKSLSGFSGHMHGVDVDCIFLDDQNDGEEKQDGTEQTIFKEIQDYIIKYRDTVSVS